ncbi:MAG: type IX secretion system protein PorQ [Salibacteraceae bacterium]
MLKQILIFIFLFSFFGGSVLGQSRKATSYSFLDIPVSARSSSMGGSSIGLVKTDINLVNDNPANLDTSLHQNFAINYINYVSDINAGSFYYANKFKKGTIGIGLQFLGYGKFEERAENGDLTGEFKVGDYALNVGYGRSIDSLWSYGGNIKLIYSNYYTRSNVAAALDLGMNFKSKSKNFTAGLTLKNLGTSLSKNTAGDFESLPFEIEIGLSQRVPKSPFRFNLQYHHIEQWDLASQDPNYSGDTKTDTKTGETSPKKFTSDNFFRHFVLGTDLIFGKNFYLTVAYNFQRRAELKIEQAGALSGFSLGVGMKIKRIRFNYSFAQYSAGGSSNHIGISTNFGEYFTKK